MTLKLLLKTRFTMYDSKVENDRAHYLIKVLIMVNLKLIRKPKNPWVD